MKKVIAFVAALAVLIGMAAPVQAQDMQGLIGDTFAWDFAIDIGQLFLGEDWHIDFYDDDILVMEVDANEDFDAYMWRALFTAGNYDFKCLEGGLTFGIFGTENQSDNLSLYMTGYDDLEPVFEADARLYWSADIHGFQILPEIGWGGEWMDGVHVAGLLGYGYRRTELERTPIYDSNYDVHWINFKGRVAVEVPGVEGLMVLIQPEIGPVIASKRTGDILADEEFTVRGDGGVMFSLRGDAVYQINENIRAIAGVFYDLEYLDGGSLTRPVDGGAVMIATSKQDEEVRFEWSDHLVQTVGGTLGVEFLF